VRTIIMSVCSVFLFGCLAQRPAQLTTIKGSSCHTKPLSNGALIYCDDSSFSYIYNGKNGKDGSDGVAGTSCSISSENFGATITCEDGSTVDIQDGLNGENGNQGPEGATGKDGESCSIADAVNGAVITCGSDSAVVLDGQAGVDGADGLDAVNPVISLVDPCGDSPGFDEVLLQLSDGTFVAYFEQGEYRFLSIISDGNYRTTDAQQCYFRIENGLLISNSYRGKRGKK
jgi:hypothetical protein